MHNSISDKTVQRKIRDIFRKQCRYYFLEKAIEVCILNQCCDCNLNGIYCVDGQTWLTVKLEGDKNKLFLGGLVSQWSAARQWLAKLRKNAAIAQGNQRRLAEMQTHFIAFFAKICLLCFLKTCFLLRCNVFT